MYEKLCLYPITPLDTDDRVGPSADTHTADRTHTGYDLGSGTSAGCNLYSYIELLVHIDCGYVNHKIISNVHTHMYNFYLKVPSVHRFPDKNLFLHW